MSVSFWKMSPKIVFLGGREEAKWLDLYMAGNPSQDSTSTSVQVNAECINAAEKEAAECDEGDEQTELSKRMVKELRDMLAEHVEENKGRTGDGGKDWFEISISW